ncbi:MAG TPA: PAS domain-containing protein [Rhizomicrobium sp.]|jgi:hypothetical protein
MISIADLLARTDGPVVEVDRSVALTRDANRKAYAYWRAARGTRRWPARRDLTPQGMKPFMRHVGLVERRAHAQGGASYVIRYAGAKIETVYGPITGKALGEFLTPELEARWRIIFDAAFQAKEPIRFATSVMFGGKNYLAAEVLLAPLGEGDEVSMLFAGVDIWPAHEADKA